MNHRQVTCPVRRSVNDREGSGIIVVIVSPSSPPNRAFHRAGGWGGLLVLWVLLKEG